MKNYLRVSVISWLLIATCNTLLIAQPDHGLDFWFDDCQHAFDVATIHINNDSIIFFQKKVRFDWHKESKNLNDYIKNEIKRADQFDSLMLVTHNIKVTRHMNYMYYDRTQGCYNEAIKRHMDSTYVSYFMIRILNMVTELNGDPPLVEQSFFDEKDKSD